MATSSVGTLGASLVGCSVLPPMAGTASSPPNLGMCAGVPSSVSSVAATSPGSVASTTSPASVSSVLDTPTAGNSSTAQITNNSSNNNLTNNADSSGQVPGTTPGSTTLSAKEIELQRKRARDRKSQQAMRDRTKWTIFNLNEQVAYLTQMLSDRARDVHLLNSRLRMLETENSQLRAQNAALQLSLMGSQPQSVDLTNDAAAAAAAASALAGGAPGTSSSIGSCVSPPDDTTSASGQSGAVTAALPEVVKKPWEIPPADGPPTCLSDQILQGFITSKVHQRSVNGALAFGLKPNLCSLLEKDRRTCDAISDIVGDIVRSYFEIDTLPKQVAVFYIMCSLLKWLVLLDKPSWDLLPAWLRPTRTQISTPHAAWIDRIPWPAVRNYLISHPEITLDHFAAVYSTSFSIRWPYDPTHVLLKAVAPDTDVTINPVYEEHIRQLRNWEVGKAFRDRYPDIGNLIDRDALGQNEPMA
ncbi:uncharacterized protein SPSK_04278 [Sporothrix schenckii 1099-18]|uniref:BZIP transcription factor n=1 Tax=Sporothrix schenckii 1099-18 TaxID=1397361 RepID=A0A0F2M6L0_SPOSC|nr:uncharacterized protein SPSK_04278 [Sporothrix schenckii 1099-18]KJR83826.1 hypothetical protein SPSK_04278 [Sporothrix schenckii 1099-18]